MTYHTEPAYTHGTPARTGILLINLGTPDAPTPSAVRRYLKEFLGDPRVVEIPRLLWWFILNGIILNVRPRKSAAKYASIWTAQGSPLRLYTERQTQGLRAALAQSMSTPPLVEYAMRYGNPSIPSVLQRMKAQNCQRILVVPLYPQYAASTTATATDMVFAELQRMRNTPALRTVRNFHDHPGYIRSLANSVQEYWAQHGRPEKLLMSFHGLPRYTLEKGDPYHCECQKTGRLLAEALGLTTEQYMISFQSRFGRQEWLQPYTSATLENWGAERIKRVDVVCPGFVADCLETLEEIAMEGKETFQHAGGGEYHYIPCLNERTDWIEALGELVTQNLAGWPLETAASELEASRRRAEAQGAAR